MLRVFEICIDWRGWEEIKYIVIAENKYEALNMLSKEESLFEPYKKEFKWIGRSKVKNGSHRNDVIRVFDKGLVRKGCF